MQSAELNSGDGGPRDDAAPRSATGRALVPLRAGASRRWYRDLRLSPGVVAAAVAVAMGTGFVGGAALLTARPQTVAAAVPAAAAPGLAPESPMDVLYRMQGEVRALKASVEGLRATAEARPSDEPVRALRRSVDTLRGDLDGVRSAGNAALGQLSAKLDRLDRDPGPKLAEIASRIEKLERERAEGAPRADRLAEIGARIERLERQVSAPAPTASIPPQAPVPPPRVAAVAPTAVPVPRPEAPGRPAPVKAEATPRPEAPPHPAAIDGWLLRDVYGGVALVEGRSGGLREVAPGEYVPGVGEIRSIERRGRGWVVVTSRGLIQADNRW